MNATGFHFGVPIEICGKTYYIDLNREGMQERLAAMHKRIQDEVAQAKETDNLRPLVDLTKEYIDTIFGEGSYDTIFTGRVLNSFDISAIYSYIASVANEQARKLRAARAKK